MKKQTVTIVLAVLSLASYGQLLKPILQPFEREDGRGTLIITPLLAHNLSERRISSEAGLSIGIEAISNQSSISLGFVYRRFFEKDINKPSFHAIRLSSAVYPFANFGLGLSAHSDLRRGEYLNDKVTVGANILDDCGVVIGKEDDTRGSSTRNRVFGTIGLIYKIDNNFRVETVMMMKDYTPNRWFDNVATDPFGRSVLKVAMSYTIPVIDL